MVKWFLVYPLMISSLVIDMVFKPAFFVTGPIWAGGILAYWRSTGRGRPHYLVAALCMLALSLVQWLGFVGPGRRMFSVFGLVLICLADRQDRRIQRSPSSEQRARVLGDVAFPITTA